MEMNLTLKELINNLTQDIIAHYQIQIPIMDIDQVVKKLGGRIVSNEYMTDMSAGRVQREGDGFVIYVSPFQRDERRKFTIARELGHLFLHMGYQISQDLWNNQENVVYHRLGDSFMEYMANEFAAALLMPRKEYKKIVDTHTTGEVVDTGKIAKYFGVSISVASSRGKFLGYLQ